MSKQNDKDFALTADDIRKMAGRIKEDVDKENREVCEEVIKDIIIKIKNEILVNPHITSVEFDLPELPKHLLWYAYDYVIKHFKGKGFKVTKSTFKGLDTLIISWKE